MFSDFKRVCTRIEDNGRPDLISSMFRHAEDIAALRGSDFRIPNFKVRDELEKRAERVGDRILRLI